MHRHLASYLVISRSREVHGGEGQLQIKMYNKTINQENTHCSQSYTNLWPVIMTELHWPFAFDLYTDLRFTFTEISSDIQSWRAVSYH